MLDVKATVASPALALRQATLSFEVTLAAWERKHELLAEGISKATRARSAAWRARWRARGPLADPKVLVFFFFFVASSSLRTVVVVLLRYPASLH